MSESLSPKFDVCTMSDNEGYNPTSEVCRVLTIELGPAKGQMVIIWPISDFEIKYEIKMLTFGS